MREIVIVIKDLYLEPDTAAGSEGSVAGGEASGIQHLARFGSRALLAQGWRAWVAQWLGVPQYAGQPPASVAAVALVAAPAEPSESASRAVPADRAKPADRTLPMDHAVWLATPLYLIAGLTSLHFDRRSILRLERAEAEELAASFAEVFRGSGYELHALEGGELLLSAPPAAAPATTEPARMLLTSIAESLPAGEGAAALRRLSAEIEMWLHDHPLNAQRARRGAPTVATLWVWGGGAPAIPRPAASRDRADLAFGSDAYIRGLWRLAGGEARPMPVDWTAVLGERRASRALGVVEVAELLHANASWSLVEAVAEIDRRLVSPLLAALHRGDLDRLVLVANDRSLTVRAADRWRLWRRVRKLRTGLEELA